MLDDVLKILGGLAPALAPHQVLPGRHRLAARIAGAWRPLEVRAGHTLKPAVLRTQSPRSWQRP